MECVNNGLHKTFVHIRQNTDLSTREVGILPNVPILCIPSPIFVQ